LWLDPRIATGANVCLEIDGNGLRWAGDIVRYEVNGLFIAHTWQLDECDSNVDAADGGGLGLHLDLDPEAPSCAAFRSPDDARQHWD